MSRWTHAICDVCWGIWTEKEPTARLRAPTEEACCFCGMKTKSGIYVRSDGSLLVCKGACNV